ncbi:MAG TPA: nitroreductase [Burkholderiales bacterium]|nr:nitroreductase [Burkholderiales bacterium]
MDTGQGFAQLLAGRYSCRAFLPRPVERATIEKILELAQRTPSWCNAQPWQAHITSGAATERLRAGLFAHVQAHAAAPEYPFPREYRGAHLARRRECGFQLYEAVGVARGDRAASAKQAMENYRLFGAPHAMIVTTDEALGVYGVLDCGAWVSNFMLAARSLGVASIAQAALATHPGFLRDFFSIGEDRRIVCGMSFGYEDAQHPANRFRTRRANNEEVARWLDA